MSSKEETIWMTANQMAIIFKKDEKTIRKHTTNVHDRYTIIDQSKIYHIGASIKDLGKKIFSISESDNNLIPILLNYI